MQTCCELLRSLNSRCALALGAHDAAGRNQCVNLLLAHAQARWLTLAALVAEGDAARAVDGVTAPGLGHEDVAGRALAHEIAQGAEVLLCAGGVVCAEELLVLVGMGRSKPLHVTGRHAAGAVWVGALDFSRLLLDLDLKVLFQAWLAVSVMAGRHREALC